jgi:hypothetical protein
VVFTPGGPDSGTINLDGAIISYSGLEPILYPIPTDNIIFNLTSSDDEAIIETGSGYDMQIRSTSSSATFELTGFNIPTVSLTINGQDGNDSVTVASNLFMPGADLAINAETITVNSGVTISTRQTDAIGVSTGDSGDIELTGETITVGSGAALLGLMMTVGFQRSC